MANYAAEVKALDQRAADYINANGGLAGCQIGLVYHDFHVLGASGFSGESESECVDFAQDQHVFAVIPQAAENATLVTCLGQSHVIDLFNQTRVYYPTPHDYAQYRGYLYEPDSINPYRWGPYIDLLAKYGFLGAGAKVGILLSDDGTGHNQYLVNNVWTPGLTRLGLTPIVYTYNAVESGSDVGTTSQQMQSAALQFKAGGVNRVMFTPDGSSGQELFTPAAQNQDYHPRYALNGLNEIGHWTTAPSGQQAGAMAVSYDISDLGGTSTPQLEQQAGTNPTNASREACRSIYSGHTGSTPVASFYQFCDDLFFLRAALAGASTVSPQALSSGADRLGSSLQLASGYANASMGQPDHYDGGMAVRMMTWDTTANGWTYTSSPEPVP